MAGLALSCLLSSTVATTAKADDPETHDGLYWRVGAGIGGLSIDREADPAADIHAYDSKSEAGATANAFELSIGTTALEGFVIGGKGQLWITEDEWDFISNRGGGTVYKRMLFGYGGIMVDWYWDELNRRSELLRGRAMDPALRGPGQALDPPSPDGIVVSSWTGSRASCPAKARAAACSSTTRRTTTRRSRSTSRSTVAATPVAEPTEV